jgi:hypothetical protein
MHHACSLDLGLIVMWFSLGTGIGLLAAYFVIQPPS